MALSNEDFNKALTLAVGRQQQGFPDVPKAKSAWSFKEAGQDFMEMGEDIKRDTQSRLTKMQQAQQDAVGGGIGKKFEAGSQIAGQGVGIGLDWFSNAVMGAGKMILSGGAESVVSEKTGQVLDYTGIADVAKEYYDWKQSQDLNTQRNIETAALAPEFILDRLGLGSVAKTGKFGKEAVQTTVKYGQDLGQKVVDITPTNIRNAIRKAPETDRIKAIDSLEQSYRTSFIDDQMAVNNKLEKLAKKSFDADSPVTADRLVRELAEEGVVPQVDGKLAKFDDFYKEVDVREAEIGSLIDKRLAQEVVQTPLDKLKSETLTVLRQDPNIAPDLIRTEQAIERIFTSLERKYGDALSPQQVNEVRKQMNRRTGSFQKEEFDIDAEAAVGRAARETIDNIVPTRSIREANAELARLYRLRDTADIFHNRQIDVGMLGSKLGSWLGVTAAAPIGFTVAGPGGLVVAGIASKIGSDAIAQMLRNMRFGDANREAIIKAIKRDPYAVRKLIDEAEGNDRAFLERLLLPARSGETPIEVGGRYSTRPDASEVKAVPADKQVVRSKGGRFARGYTSEPAGTEAARIQKRIEERLSESYSSSLPKYLKNNKQAGFFAGERPREKQLQSYIKDQEKRLQNIEKAGKTDSKQYSDIQKEIGVARRMLDDLGKAQSAMTKTTDLSGKEVADIWRRKGVEVGDEDLLRIIENDGAGFQLREIKISDIIKNDPENAQFITDPNIRPPRASADEPVIIANDGVIDGIHRIAQKYKENPDATIQAYVSNRFVSKTTDLLEEARKYPDAESFVKAQGTPVFQGVAADVNKINTNRGEVYFTTSKRAAENYSEDASFTKIKKQGIKEGHPKYSDFWDEDGRLKKKVNEAITPQMDNPLIVDAKRAEWDEIKTPSEMGGEGTKTTDQITKWAKNNGYDGVIFKDLTDAGLYETSTDYVVFDPSKIKTREQLEMLWREANE